jgi:hypothetical protein
MPDVMGAEIPSFQADVNFINSTTKTNTVFTDRRPDNTVYSIWIGTNDLGAGTFLTDSTVPGTTLTNYTECVFQAFDAMYAAGGRNFVLMNVGPLQLTPGYAILGTGPNGYWPDKVSKPGTRGEQAC